MAIPPHTHGAAFEGSKDYPDDTEGDAVCCSYCFCCHFAGVPMSNVPSPSLVVTGFLASNYNPLPLQLSVSPFDKPPQA